MGFKDRIRTKNEGLLERKPITLPRSGEPAIVRSLMSGALLRINSALPAQKELLTVALCLEDPDTPGALAYLPHSQEDLDAIAAFHQDDLIMIVQTATELSGGNETQAAVLGN